MYRKIYKKFSNIMESKELSNNEKVSRLSKMVFSSNNEIRRKIAEVLVDDEFEFTEREWILYHLTFDKDIVVKMEAIDSLACGTQLQSLQRLEQLCSDIDADVRYFSVVSYYHVYMKLYENCNDIEKKIDLLYNHDYSLFSPVIYALAEIENEHNKTIIQSFIEKNLDKMNQEQRQIIWRELPCIILT